MASRFPLDGRCIPGSCARNDGGFAEMRGYARNDGGFCGNDARSE